MQASPSACSHGKPLRGLMATPLSNSSEGRFGRMFPISDTMQAATHGKDAKASRDTLMELGRLMTSKLDAPKDGFDAEEGGVPALYTYFSQFVDHDITFDPMSLPTQQVDPDALTNFRTPALDLDNMYGRGPADQPYMYDNAGTKFLLGRKLESGDPDLPRNNANPARAIIGDPRNDENSIVSQFQALMLRFHNRVVDDHPDLEFPAVQQLVRWHYQWVVVHDFLPKIIKASVLDSLKTNGRYDESKLKFYRWKNQPFIPVEFSVAAYRLGHSMVRAGYRLNNDDATLLQIFPVTTEVNGATPKGSSQGLTGLQAMASNRGIDWGRFIDVGEPRPRGEDPDKVPSVTAAMKNRLQLAYRLDTSVVTPLSVLPASIAPDEPRSLAQRNLLRGFELGLPTGQSIARAMGVVPLTDDQIVIGKAVDAPTSDDVAGPVSKIPELAGLKGQCPLWTYILAEAALPSNRKNIVTPVTEKKEISTPQLGEVGGRIVAEVFLGILFADSTSFLSARPEWVPSIGKAKAGFALRDIVAYARGQ